MMYDAAIWSGFHFAFQSKLYADEKEGLMGYGLWPALPLPGSCSMPGCRSASVAGGSESEAIFGGGSLASGY